MLTTWKQPHYQQCHILHICTCIYYKRYQENSFVNSQNQKLSKVNERCSSLSISLKLVLKTVLLSNMFSPNEYATYFQHSDTNFFVKITSFPLELPFLLLNIQVAHIIYLHARNGDFTKYLSCTCKRMKLSWTPSSHHIQKIIRNESQT